MAAEWWTVAEIGKRLGTPETTVRRYARAFAEYLPSRQFGRVTKYGADALEVMERISRLYGQGLTTPEVEEALSGEGYSQTVEVEPQTGPSSSAMLMPLMIAQAQAQNETLQRLTDALEKIAEREDRLTEMEKRLAKVENEARPGLWERIGKWVKGE